MKVYQQVFTYHTPRVAFLHWSSKFIYRSEEKAREELQKTWNEVRNNDDVLDCATVVTLFLDQEL